MSTNTPLQPSTMESRDIKQIVVSRDTAVKLLTLGIKNISILHWYKMGEFYTPMMGGYVSDVTFEPAWTLEELRIMIGDYFAGPDLPDKSPFSKTPETLKFIILRMDKQEEFENGAEAAAAMLFELIKSGQMTAEDANKRYSKVFKK